MHKATVALLTLLALAPLAEAHGTTMSFSAPASFQAEKLDTQGSQWALIVFRDGSEGSASIGSAGPHEQTNWTQVRPIRVREGFDTEVMPYYYWEQSTTPVEKVEPFALGFGRNQGAVYIEAESISTTAGQTIGQIDYKASDEGLLKFKRPEDKESNLYRNHLPAGQQAVTRLEGTVPTRFALEATGVRSIEWYNASVECQGDGCPAPGGPSDATLASISGYNATSERDTYSGMVGALGNVSLTGSFDYLVAGADLLTAGINGRLRLPLATSSPSCDSCIAPTEQTLTLEGSIELRSLQYHEGSLHGQLVGDLQTARLDETSIDPALLTGPATAVVAATAAGLFVLKFLLAPLFTRLSKEQALEHPRRRAIFEHVQRNPGTSFRETARVVGIAAGTVRHHLNVLQRAGMVVERPHGATVRFFENHGKHDADWVEVVMLREPALRLLFDWLKQHPKSPQTAILEAMEVHGWSRSTTQHRLSRLVDAGLATIRLQGRYKMYSVADKPPPPPAGRPNLMAPTPSA